MDTDTNASAAPGTPGAVVGLSWAYIGKGKRLHAFRDPSHTYAICGCGGDKTPPPHDPLPAETCWACSRKANKEAAQ